MTKKTIIGVGILFILVFSTGCDLIKKDDGGGADFERGPQGLVMSFLPNYPGDKYLVSENTDFSVVVDVKNEGTYPEEEFDDDEGSIYLSGFDTDIIDMDDDDIYLYRMYLPGASPINPVGSFDTAEFEGTIRFSELEVDEYNPIFLVTACYHYETKASPPICIDPYPFDERQDKVCHIGTKTLSTQGAPITVNRIEQEATTNRVQFKIFIKCVLFYLSI